MTNILGRIRRLQRLATAIGMLGLISCVLGYVLSPEDFQVSYLFAFMYWISLSLGCFYLALIHYLTGGRWGFPARRVLEAGYMTLPVMLLFFLPILLGLRELYPWAQPETVAAEKVLQARAVYESPLWFTTRAVFYFAAWIVPATLLRRWSLQQDVALTVAPMIKVRTLSGPAVAFVPLTASFAFIDWAMSAEAKWYSTVFPVIILAGQILMATAFAVVMLAGARNEPALGGTEKKLFQDLANLLLAFVMFWTYVAFSQLIIIYSANLPQEIGWYVRRIHGGWLWLVASVVLFHFVAPFFLLLFRKVKQYVGFLSTIAVVVLLTHATELYWAIEPTFHARLQIHWTAVAAWFGLGGIWLAVFLGNLKRHPLLARPDPRFGNPVPEVARAK